MPSFASTLLSLALAGLLTLAAYTDPLAVAAVVAVVQLLIAQAPSPSDATGHTVHGPRFAATVAAGAVATVLTVEPHLLRAADGSSTKAFGETDNGMLSAIMPAIVAGVFVALASQMLRKDGRKNLVSTTSYAVALGVFAALTVGWIGAVQSLGDAEVVAVGAAGVAGGLLVWLVPIDRWLCGSAAVIGGAVAGAVVSYQVELTWALGVAVGSGAALFAVLGQILGRSWSQGRTHAAAGWGFPGAMSIALAAPVIYVGGQLIGAPGF
ncbi:MAG: hypothetical protein QOJ72_571 [Nocardioidaceae bacterium]|nr:hypothetical protein [Nocardioidaceae bacterium]